MPTAVEQFCIAFCFGFIAFYVVLIGLREWAR